MQILPTTAEEIAAELELAWSPTLLSDPQQNVRLGARFYANLLDRYAGSHLPFPYLPTMLGPHAPNLG